MAQVEHRLGRRPHFAAFDAAFDAFYVYVFFHSQQHAGFAAVPFAEKGGYAHRAFSATDGAPLCKAGLPMLLRFAFTDRTRAIIEHQRAKYGCPLRYPVPTDHP